MSDIIRLLADAIRDAEPDGDPFADQDLCVGEAMEGFDWMTEEHIQALCEAAAKAALSALADAGLAVRPTAHTDRSVPCPTCGFRIRNVPAQPFVFDDQDLEPETAASEPPTP